MRSINTLDTAHILQQWLWRKTFSYRFSAQAGLSGDGTSLRLLLGTAWSGMDWFAGILRHGDFGVRFYNEPLGKLLSASPMSHVSDPMSIGYSKELDQRHPLIRFYRMLAEPDDAGTDRRPEPQGATAPGAEPVYLMKETRALLTTEALLRGLECRVMAFVNDPVFIVDRLFGHGGRDSHYLQHEAKAVLAPAFLKRFLRHEVKRVVRINRVIQRLPEQAEREVLGRILAVALIQRMFRMLAARYPDKVTLVSYQEIQEHPQIFVDKVTQFYGERFRSSAESVLSHCTVTTDEEGRLFWTTGASNTGRKAMALTPKEIASSYELLADARLQERHRWLTAVSSDQRDTVYSRAMSHKASPTQPAPANSVA